jgi:hypothetical protein
LAGISSHHNFVSSFPKSTKVLLLALLAASGLLPFVFKRLTPLQKVVFPSVLLFPFAYYVALFFLSDWPLWGWYWYAIRPALCVSAVITYIFLSKYVSLRSPVFPVVLYLSAAAYAFTAHWTSGQPDITDAALGSQEFASTHPGTYAMGDRAGRVGYMLGQPMVQLEGLVMDRSFLELLRRQTPLRQVLAQYHVRYYIATEYSAAGCFESDEPHQGGASTPHMRGQFCETPVAIFPEPGLRTVIFDLAPGSTNPNAVH